MTGSPLRVLVVAGSLLVLTNGPLFLVARRVLEGAGTWEDPAVRSPLVATSLVAAGIVLLDRHRVSGRRLRRPSLTAAAAIALYSSVAVLSTHWSLAPELTLWRAATYLGLPFLAWIVADLDPTRRQSALRIVLVVAVIASIVIVIGSSTIGLDRNDDWRGIYTNRNSLAPLAALGMIVGTADIAGTDVVRRLTGGTVVLASTIVLLGTGSRTAWLALGMAGGVASLVVLARRIRDRAGVTRASATVVGLGGAGLVVVALAVSRLWSEPTFEQRRTIWSLTWDRIQDRPLHGHGFFAVWDVPSFVADHFLLERGSAHGSALDVWLGVGLVGLVPFGVIIVMAAYSAGRDAWRHPAPTSWAWLAIIAFLLVENVTESFVLWFSYNWVLVMAAALRLGMSPDRAGPDLIPRDSATDAVPAGPDRGDQPAGAAGQPPPG